MSLNGPPSAPDPDNHQQQQAALLAHRYGLTLDEEEQDELAWIIEAMGLEEAEAECARSRAMLIRSGQLDPDDESHGRLEA